MKKDFSKSWKSSKQPRKQRKYVYNAPLSVLGRLMHSTLSKELRKKYSKRSIRVRKGDKVRILRGKFKKKEGKINRVDLKKHAVYIDGIEITKKEGAKRFVPIHPSNLMIIEMVDDKRRIKSAKQKDSAKKPKPKEEKIAEKTEKKPKETKAAEKTEKKAENKNAKSENKVEAKSNIKSNSKDNLNNNKTDKDIEKQLSGESKNG